MPPPSPVTDYLDRLAHALSFDAALARRVRREVEDHLSEAAAAALVRGDDAVAAERRAVASFGDPHDIARGYAAPSLFRRARRAGVTAIVVVAGIYAAMKLRIALYSATPLVLSGAMKTIREIVFSIDIYAFQLALAAVILSAIYLACRRVPGRFHRAYGKELRAYFLLFGVTTGALAVSVLSDTLLTGLRLFFAATSPPSAWVGALSMAAEAAFAGALAFQLRRSLRWMASAASLCGT